MPSLRTQVSCTAQIHGMSINRCGWVNSMFLVPYLLFHPFSYLFHSSTTPLPTVSIVLFAYVYVSFTLTLLLFTHTCVCVCVYIFIYLFIHRYMLGLAGSPGFRTPWVPLHSGRISSALSSCSPSYKSIPPPRRNRVAVPCVSRSGKRTTPGGT